MKRFFKIADLIKVNHLHAGVFLDDNISYGIVLDTNINMWNEETEPSGVEVMWPTGEVETVFEDEIVLASTGREK